MKELLRILFVEDDLVDQMAFKRFIEREKLPYDCEICGSVSAARNALHTKQFDIVLTDHSLGDGTAFDLFGDIGDIPFIIITGSGNEEIAVQAMNAGATDYLIKDPDSNYFVTLPSTIISALEYKRSEAELVHHREHLEELVRERTDELTRTNIELQQSEEKFRLLAENSIDCIWTLDTKLRFTYISPSVEIILGYKPEQMVGTKISAHFKKKDFLKVGTLAAKAIANYKTFTEVIFETKMLNSKNEKVDIEISSKVLLNSQGKLIGLQGTTKDITERKQAEQEIEMLLNLSRQASTETNLDDLLFFIANQIVKVVPPAEATSIFLYDEKRKVVRVQAWDGFNDSEIEGLEFSIDSRQVGRLFQTKKPALIKDVSKNPDFELIDKPSLKITKSQIAVPLIYKKSIIGIIFADNLTRTDAFSQKNLDLLESIGNQLAGVIENARLLENIRHSRERYQSVADDSPGLINRFLPDGTITFVNQECCRFFGKTYKELIGTNIQATILEEDRDSVMSNIASLTKESPIQVFENKVIKYDGEIRWMRWTDRALFGDKGQVITIQSFGEDITTIKQAQEKEQQHLLKIAFLSKTAMRFVDFPPEKDIYRFIGEQLRELAGESIVVVNSIDNAKGILTNRAIIGMGKYAKDIMKLIGSNPEEMEYDANDENLTYLNDGELHDYKEGLYGIFLGTVPRPACRTIEKLIRLNKIYTIGFIQNARSFGNAIIFLPRGVELESAETIKLFIEQASIAIQRRHAEQALEQEKEKAQEYLGIAEVMIMALNEEGEITLLNQKGAGILGYQIEDLTGKNWFDTCVPAAYRKRAKEIFDKFIAGGEGLGKQFEQTIITKSGEERIINLHSTPLLNEKKNRIGSLSSGEDITERMRVEKENRKFNKIIETTTQSVIVTNMKGTVIYVNQSYYAFSGFAEDEVIGKSMYNFAHKKGAIKLAKEVIPALLKKRHWQGEMTVVKKDKQIFPVELNCSLLSDNKNKPEFLVAIFSDISERKRTGQLLRALNRAAVVMGRAQTHKEIFNAVANELKQLDTSCMLFPLDETRSKLVTKFISYESAILKPLEKLVGLKYEKYSFPIDTVDAYRSVIKERETLFEETSEHTVRQMFPKLSKKIITLLVKISQGKKTISAPLIVEDEILGMFLVQSDSLTQEDIPAITAFADQLSSAWNKIGLLHNLKKSLEGTIHTIAATVETRDPYTAGHQARVADLAAAIANEMSLTDEQVEGIKMAGIIHDLGKINVPAEILSKPGKLSDLEFEIIKTHPQTGFDLLKNIEFPWPIAEMILQHHEKMDGSGYPQGLKGDEILLDARILAVADIVEAMSSHRPYRPALGIEKALAQVKQDKDTLLDPKVVDACLKIFKEGYKLPTGKNNQLPD